MTTINYTNGNASIVLENNGSRTIEYENSLELEYPLNIDIRVSTECSFGLNLKTNKAFCSFCHESAVTNGKECDYNSLKAKLIGLPKGIELAIGCNNLTENLLEFLKWSFDKGFVCNLTINQGHILRDSDKLLYAISENWIKGLGISYRKDLVWKVPQKILDYPNSVFHVISGIDDYQDVESLSLKGVKKILILGEKDFGFNSGKVNINSKQHKEWFWKVYELFSKFNVVSFDNLAIEQLKIKRFFNDSNWKIFNQGEYSFYINAVDQYFSPSSRNPEKTHFNNSTIKDYFKQINK